MPVIDPTAWATLLAVAQPAVCEYLKVTWDSGHIHYYGGAAWQDEDPFTAIGVTVESRIIYPDLLDPFTPLELYPDLRTDNIPVVFDDIDGAITDLFETYGSGVLCEVFYYYPDISTNVSMWSGQLQAADVDALDRITTTITNGSRSREVLIPGRLPTVNCSFNLFGGALADADAVRSNGCDYDRHVGGSRGNFITGSTPYTDCPKDPAACLARMGDMKSFGGFNPDAGTMTFMDHGHSYLAIATGNQSKITTPIREIYGTKYVRASSLLYYRPEAGGYTSGVWMIGGKVSQVYNIWTAGFYMANMHINIALGARGQVATNFSAGISNLSATSHVFVRVGPLTGNKGNISMDQFDIECNVIGNDEICVYTDATTKTRIYSDNRVWCLLECYHNQNSGLGYAESQFTGLIDDWIDAATWCDETVSHTAYLIVSGGGASESVTLVSRRSSFNAILEGNPSNEQILDICRSGGLSVPFDDGGSFSIAPFRIFTTDELNNAVEFTDAGDEANILTDDKNVPMLSIAKLKNDKIINEITVNYESGINKDTETTIIVNDKAQQLLAGKLQGTNYYKTVPKTYVGFGINNDAEARRFGFRMLKYGEFDTGGTDNPLTATLTVDAKWALGVRRYGCIKITAARTSRYSLPSGVATDLTTYPVVYFRVLSIKKIDKNRATITAQVYNQNSIEHFEVSSGVIVPDPGSGGSNCYVLQAGTYGALGGYEYAGQLNSKPRYLYGVYSISWSGSAWEIKNGSTVLYTSSTASDFPWDANPYSVSGGLSPAAAVYQGDPPTGDGCVITIGSVNYNATTKMIEVGIDPC